MIGRGTFEGWIAQYHQALYRHALWMVGERELAADLVQETYYQAWKVRGSLRDEAKALSWLLTILRRRVFEEYDRARRARVTAEELRASAPEEGVAPSDEQLDLARALAALTPPQRDILLLHVLHGFTYAEIADQLDIPLGTVMSRLARSRAALEQALGAAPTPGDNVISLPSAMKKPNDAIR